MVPLPEATIYTAREIVTLDPARPVAEAIAVVGGRILWAGSLEEVQRVLGDQPFRPDTRFADKVIVPGFIAQHDHPVLAARSMLLSIEDWRWYRWLRPERGDLSAHSDALRQRVIRCR